MAQELERQIEQANATARSSHRSELQRTHAGGSASSRRKKPGLVVDAEAPGADQPRDQSNTLLVEVMQELNRVKRELWEMQREVKAAREAKAEADGDAETPTPRGMSPSPRTLDGVEQEAGEENEEERGRGTAELAVAQRLPTCCGETGASERATLTTGSPRRAVLMWDSSPRTRRWCPRRTGSPSRRRGPACRCSS